MLGLSPIIGEVLLVWTMVLLILDLLLRGNIHLITNCMCKIDEMVILRVGNVQYPIRVVELILLQFPEPRCWCEGFHQSLVSQSDISSKGKKFQVSHLQWKG